MQPSTENRIGNIRHEAASPQKQFTREEIKKHNKQNGCWFVINGKVYDAIYMLDWHPSGKALIIAHVGRAYANL
jgi:nitrate reductase (NAD(P)H)